MGESSRTVSAFAWCRRVRSLTSSSSQFTEAHDRIVSGDTSSGSFQRQRRKERLMHRGLSRIAMVIALGFAAFNAATMSLSRAQGPTGISEREYCQATWTLLDSIKNRQVRQDRILGFGFGATVALLIGLGIVTLKRPVSHVTVNPNAAPSEPRRTKQRMQEVSRSWIQQLAKLRLDAHHASLARRQKHITRRQKRIRSLLWQMRSQMVSLDAEINQQFRKALENLVRET